MQKFKNVLVPVFLVCLIFAAGLPACSTKAVQAETTENLGVQENNADVLLLSFNGREINAPIEEILAMDAVSKEVTAVPKDDEEKEARKVKGVLLDDILQKYLQISQKDISALRLIAGDGYAIEVASDLLNSREIILAYEIDGKPLEDWEKPLRSVVPDVFEMYWVKNLIKIEITEARQEAEVKRIIMLESRISEVESMDYQYYDEEAKAVSVEELLYDFAENPISDTVTIMASDGLKKNEKTEIFVEAFIKYTGENAPMFLSDELPKGMWIKNILYFVYGGTAYFSAASGLASIELAEAEGENAVNLSDVFSACNIMQSGTYLFKAIDGYEAQIDAASLDNGYIYIQENGLPAVYFEGLEKNTKVKDLVYIGISE